MTLMFVYLAIFIKKDAEQLYGCKTLQFYYKGLDKIHC